MRNEIGSEFWEIPIGEENNLFSEDTKWFISGRSALKAILAENSFRTAAIPMWCCDSMIKPFIDAGIKVLFYTNEPDSADVVLVMDYFGYATKKSYRDYQGIVIRDLTHSLFSKVYDDATYYFGSLRKWAGFWTGGFAWGFKNSVNYSGALSSYAELRRKAMSMKAEYICGKTEKKDYLNIFERAEDELENIGILPADVRDIRMAGCIDVAKIKSQRRKNALILLNALSEYVIYPELNEDDCPMFVPIQISERDNLRKYLIQHKIYCPIHWSVSKLHCIDTESQKLYNRELSIVCDQRYTEKDMERIVETIQSYLNKRT